MKIHFIFQFQPGECAYHHFAAKNPHIQGRHSPLFRKNPDMSDFLFIPAHTTLLTNFNFQA